MTDTSDDEKIIEVEKLNKTFRVQKRREGMSAALRALFSRAYTEVQAVRDITFTIKRGEMVGYIGPNGSGKSTTIKVLTGILVPTSGSVRVLGYTPWKQRVEYTRNIGVVFGQRTQLWWDLPVQESLSLMRSIYQIPERTYEKNLKEFTKILELKELLQTPTRKLSLGQRMRCDLAAALLHEPQVVFLDEPTIGLDINAKEAVREFIKHVNRERKTTFILTTHDMYDIEELCRRVIVIDQGSKIYDGPLENLRKRYASSKILEVEFTERPRTLKIKNARVTSRKGNKMTLKVNTRKAKVSSVVNQILKYDVHDLTIEETPIEEIIKKIYAKGS